MRSFILRLWWYRVEGEKDQGTWFGQILPVPSDDGRHFFSGFDQLVVRLKELLGIEIGQRKGRGRGGR